MINRITRDQNFKGDFSMTIVHLLVAHTQKARLALVALVIALGFIAPSSAGPRGLP